jgi:multiple sugar transport system ATP-binding protein
VAAHPGLQEYLGKQVVLGIRPEDLEDVALAPDTPADRRLRGMVELTEAFGSEIIVHFAVDAKLALTDDVRELAEDTDTTVLRDLEDESSDATVVGRFGARSRVREGETIEVAVDERALHFFDPETGAGIYNASNGKGAT